VNVVRGQRAKGQVGLLTDNNTIKGGQKTETQVKVDWKRKLDSRWSVAGNTIEIGMETETQLTIENDQNT
jgi:hypothetical protein